MRAGIIGLLALVLAPTATGAQAAYVWDSGYQQGGAWAGVLNDDEGVVRIDCPVEMTNPLPSLHYEPGRGQERGTGDEYLVLDIDGISFPLSAEWSDDGVAHHAGNWRGAAELQEIVEALRRGKSLSVRLPRRDMAESFSLQGSGAALDDILQGCLE